MLLHCRGRQTHVLSLWLREKRRPQKIQSDQFDQQNHEYLQPEWQAATSALTEPGKDRHIFSPALEEALILHAVPRSPHANLVLGFLNRANHYCVPRGWQ